VFLCIQAAEVQRLIKATNRGANTGASTNETGLDPCAQCPLPNILVREWTGAGVPAGCYVDRLQLVQKTNGQMATKRGRSRSLMGLSLRAKPRIGFLIALGPRRG
jgi:hypothetical protein